MDIRAKGRKAIKTLEDKLDAEVVAHGWMKEEYKKLQKEANKKDAMIKGLWELADKKKAWYEEQLAHEREQSHQVEVCLNNEMGQLEEYT